jgi:fibronectin-binding autotransporter adhesin
MKQLSLLCLLSIAMSFTARAYNHKWIGPNQGLWAVGDNWTNNFPNPTENREMRLFFPSLLDGKTTYQNVNGLFVDYMEINGEYTFADGGASRLGFRNTNSHFTTISIKSSGRPTFAPDLELVLQDEVAVFITPSGVSGNPVGFFLGPISGPGSFYVDGNGAIEFGGGLANTYAGLTTVVDGTLRLNKSGGVAVPGDLVIGYGLGSENGIAAKVLFLRDDQLLPRASVNVLGQGWLNLDGHDQSLNNLTLLAGRVSTGTGTLSLGETVTSQPGDRPALIEGRVGLGFVPTTFNIGGHYTNEELRVTARVSGGSGATLIKNGPGTLSLAGTNSYLGTTRINQGVLLATGPSPLGSATGGTVVQDGATLHLEMADLGDEPLTLAGQGDEELGAVFVDGAVTGNGPVTLAEDTRIIVWTGSLLGLNGVVSGPGGLELIGGRLFFGGSEANTYTGTTRVLSTTLELKKHLTILGGGSIGLLAVPGPISIGPGIATARYFYDNQISDAVRVTLAGNGQLDLNGHHDIIGSLAGDGGTVALGNGELSIGGDHTSTTSAAVMTGAGGRLRKIGTGALTLTASHTYTGGTTIEAGELIVQGANGNMFVQTNGTLGGTGSVGLVFVQGGTLSPGVGPGTLNCQSVLFNSGTSGSRFHVDLDGTQPGSHDQLKVAGSVELNDCKLSARLGFAGATNSQFVIIANDGADAINGTFTGLPEGQEFYVSSTPFRISYHGGDGNDVVLTQIGPTVAPHADGVTELPNGHLQVNGTGLPLHLYLVERSVDLQQWFVRDTVAATAAGIIQYEDPDGFSLPCAFYRFVAVDEESWL